MAYVAVDFDGTIVEHEYPKIGKVVPGAFETINALVTKGHKVILHTMRSGKELNEAVEFCSGHGIVFYGVNHNPTQKSWTTSPKAYAQYYIDDASIGCPLINPDKGRPYVDWFRVQTFLMHYELI